jgi:hypothetical protein
MTYSKHHHTASPIRVVLFDVYGTLVKIAAKRAPFRRLLQIGERQGRRSSSADAVMLMTAPLSLGDAAKRLGIPLMTEEAAPLENDLRAVIDSVRLSPDTLTIRLQQPGPVMSATLPCQFHSLARPA